MHIRCCPLQRAMCGPPCPAEHHYGGANYGGARLGKERTQVGLSAPSSHSWRGGAPTLVVPVSTFLKGHVCRVLELGRGAAGPGKTAWRTGWGSRGWHLTLVSSFCFLAPGVTLFHQRSGPEPCALLLCAPARDVTLLVSPGVISDGAGNTSWVCLT